MQWYRIRKKEVKSGFNKCLPMCIIKNGRVDVEAEFCRHETRFTTLKATTIKVKTDNNVINCVR